MKRYSKFLEDSIAENKIKMAALKDVLADYKKLGREAQADKDHTLYDKPYIFGLKNAEAIVRGKVIALQHLTKKMQGELHKSKGKKKKRQSVAPEPAPEPVRAEEKEVKIIVPVGNNPQMIEESPKQPEQPGSDKHKIFISILKALSTTGRPVPISDLFNAAMLTNKFASLKEITELFEEAKKDGVLEEIKPGVVVLIPR